MSETLPFSEAKAHLSDLADQVERHHERILVTRNGRASFVMVSLDELESLEETVAILSDTDLAESIRTSRQDAAEGRTVRLERGEPYEIRITAEGQRHLTKLPEKIRSAVLAFAFEALAHRPRRVGKPLTNELDGLWSARRADYRVVYEIDDEMRTVLIHRAAHRRDVYRRP